MFIDTHCHLNMMVGKSQDAPLLPNHFAAIASIIDVARTQEVRTIINVGTSVQESYQSIRIAEQFPSVYATVGIHPCDARDDWRLSFKEIIKLVHDAPKGTVVGIGETGLDYYHKPYNKAAQHDLFRAHIELALAYDLPLVVHIRDAADDALKILRAYMPDARGVNHCFMHDSDVAKQFMLWGWYMGIDGPITYPKNEAFRSTVRGIALEYLMFETDAPFLPPQPYRGKQNSPAYIPLFAQTVADLHGVSLETCAQVTTKNAKKLFGLP